MDKYCEHGMLIYMINDSEFNSCSLCNPQTENEIRKRKVNIGYNDLLAGEWCNIDTILWLAENGTILVDCPEHAQNNFIENYFSIKNKNPDFGKYCYSKKAGWGNYMSIEFQLKGNEKEKIIFNSSLNIRKSRDNTQKISCNDFIWQLLNLGFDLGKDHDIDEILKNITKKEII